MSHGSAEAGAVPASQGSRRRARDAGGGAGETEAEHRELVDAAREVGFERGYDTFVTRQYRDVKGRRRRHKDGAFHLVREWAQPHLEAHAAQEERPPLFFYLHVVYPHDVY